MTNREIEARIESLQARHKELGSYIVAARADLRDLLKVVRTRIEQHNEISAEITGLLSQLKGRLDAADEDDSHEADWWKGSD